MSFHIGYPSVPPQTKFINWAPRTQKPPNSQVQDTEISTTPLGSPRRTGSATFSSKGRINTTTGSSETNQRTTNSSSFPPRRIVEVPASNTTMNGPLLTVPIVHGASDGDATHRPTESRYRKIDPPTLYLEKLATGWMKERGDQQRSGIRYILDRLPEGYAVYERPRPGNPNHMDRYCFGHPQGKAFDSPNRFLPHFLNLMKKGNNHGCNCTICSSPGSGKKPIGKPLGKPLGRPPGSLNLPTASNPPLLNSTSGPARPKGKQWIDGKTDDEGSPDVYRTLIDQLKVAGSLDVPITELFSMDWRAERAELQKWLQSLSTQPLWMPRNGDVVLFVRHLLVNEEVKYHSESGHFKIWNGKLWVGFPKWEAAVVTQTPEEVLDLEDIVEETRKELSVTYSGFRVEPLPDPNSTSKPQSKQYTYVRLDQIRPLTFWSELLSGTKKEAWSPTIKHAHTAASTISLEGKYRFHGQWPLAKIHCRGMYLGAEFIKEGDIVRLLPEEKGASVTDILKVTSISLNLSKLDTASGNDYDDGHPYNSNVRVTGKGFTLDKSRASGPLPANADLPEDFDRYGKFYYHQEPHLYSQVPFHRVMGRCFEPRAIERWFPAERSSESPLNLGLGIRGLLAARSFSAQINKRIPEGKSWFWADSRVEALDLYEVNGYEVSSQDKERNPKEWRKEIRIIEGVARPGEKAAAQVTNQMPHKMRNNSMINTAIGLMGNGEGSSGQDESRDASRKRSRCAMDTGDEDNEDDHFVTQMAEGIGLPMDDEMATDEEDFGEIVQDTPKGHRVMIVID
ncbi:hypothetical protein EJ08DRAFT_645623 [Tothia fuscella]|uniref:Uncharacterized protein n=1 Tax=Tothia fuscella TaxID=1048955 RepID=A0A9P4P0I9_9PEZI|nr:hypothetical protein EJ08DRAFT_645623 [Tothia fuscella]